MSCHFCDIPLYVEGLICLSDETNRYSLDHNSGCSWWSWFNISLRTPHKIIWGRRRSEKYCQPLRSHWDRDATWVSICLSHQDAAIDKWQDLTRSKVNFELRSNLRLTFWGYQAYHLRDERARWSPYLFSAFKRCEVTHEKKRLFL